MRNFALFTFRKTFALFLIAVLGTFSVSAQNFCPQDPIPNDQLDLRGNSEYTPGECPANDIVILGASLDTGDVCNSCDEGELITANLLISIDHGTNSANRFLGVFADITETLPDGSTEMCKVSRCSGPVLKDSEETGDQQILDFGEITFTCGSSLQMSNILLVWTAAMGECPVTPANNPNGKYCYANPVIDIVPPLSAVATAECNTNNLGDIDLTVMGGTGSFTYAWTGPNSFSSTVEDPTDLEPGDYTVVVTDQILDGGVLIDCTTTTTVTVPECFTCPTLSNETTDVATCEDDQGQTLSVDTDVSDIDIEFVYFSSSQSNPYSGGTQIGTAVTPVAGTATSSAGINGLAPGTYFAYAILDIDDQNLTDPNCRPFAEIEIIINELPVIDIADQEVCSDVGVVDLTALEPAGQTGGTWSNASGDIADASAVNPYTRPFTYTYTDANGCTGSDQVTYTINDIPQVVIADQEVCADVTSVDLTALEPAGQTGGTWNNVDGVIADPTDVAPIGPFQYFYTDANGCFGSAEVAYTINELPVIDIADQEVCTSVTSVDLTALEPMDQMGGVWSNAGGDIMDATDVDPTTGMFTYTYTNANGCTGIDFVAYTFDDLPVIDIANQEICADVTTVDLTTLEPAGQTGGEWSSGGSVLADASSVDPTTGPFTYTYSDGNGCVGTAEVEFTVSEAPVPVITGDSTYCYDDNGVVLDAGAGYASYLWSPGGETTQTITATSGAYTVSVTSYQGCTGTSEAIVIQSYEMLSCSITQDELASNFQAEDGVATVNPMGGSNDYTYLWDNGETTQTAVALTYGLHSVTVTDSECGETTCEIFISKQLICSVSLVAEASCAGADGAATVTAYGGYPEYTYLWDNGEITAQAIALSPGLHSVTITDSTGAETTCSIEIPGSTANDLSCSITQDELASNFQAEDGVATVYPMGGSNDYSYLWDNGETTPTAVSLTYGLHTVTVVDNNGCGETTCEIFISKRLICSVNLDSPISSGGGSDGKATVTAYGGYPGYTYLWDNGEITRTAVGLDYGEHTVTVTDTTGGTTQCTVFVTAPNDLSCSIVQDMLASNYLADDGVATVIPTGGSGGYTYVWDNGETTATAVNLTYGAHTVTVEDSSGQQTICEIFINKELVCSTTLISSASCADSANGVASVTAYGGFEPYTYSWDGGAFTEDRTNSTLGVGDHTVTIRDSSGATTQCVVSVPGTGALGCSITQDMLASNYLAEDGVATVLPSGGSGDYTYEWDNGETTQTATSLSYGPHTVRVTDNNGCGYTICEIFINKNLICSVGQDAPTSCYGSEDGVATITGYGGFVPYQYSWDGGEFTDSNTNYNLAAGNHTVVIMDATGATSECSVMISGPNELVANVNITNHVSITGGSDGSATAIGIGGTAPYTYAWSNNVAEDTANDLSAGTYTVTITDANGCTVTLDVVINESDTNGSIVTVETVQEVPSVGPEEDDTAEEQDAIVEDVPLVDQTSVTAYPQAFINQINLNIKINYEAKVAFEIFDMNGRVVMRDYSRVVTPGTNDFKFELERLAPDMYILIMDTGREKIVKKILSRE